MTNLVFVLNHRRAQAIDPATIAAVCIGISDLCRHQTIVIDDQRREVRAKINRIHSGSINIIFELQDLAAQPTTIDRAGEIAAAVAAGLIVEVFKWLYQQTKSAKRAKAKELAEALKSPEATGALKEIFSALQRDPAVSSMKVESGKDSVVLNSSEIELTDSMLSASEWGHARGEYVYWGKLARIVDIRGVPPILEWQIYWDEPLGPDHREWVRAVPIPASTNWRPGIDKTMMVDLKVKFRPKGRYREIESAEILHVHWGEMN